MKTIHVILLTAFAAGFAAFAPAIGQNDGQSVVAPPSGGALRTMPHGTYQCALPGDAGGEAFIEVAEETFRIFTASRYESTTGAGTYILRGDELTFTRGPKKGQQFERVGDNQLRKLAAGGTRSDLLCTRRGSR
ncbi:MAG: elongation factor P [Erythrobacter sp.]